MPRKKEYTFIEKGYEDGVKVIVHAYSLPAATIGLAEIVKSPAKFELLKEE